MEMDQQTGSKSGKEYVKAVYRLPAYLTYMQLYIMMDWMKHKVESRLLGKICKEAWLLGPKGRPERS